MRAAGSELYPATEAERQEHLRKSLRASLTTLAVVAAGLALFIVVAS
jgi:hypothetical protein